MGGAVCYANGYLAAACHGTILNPEGGPIANLRPPDGVTPESQ